MRQENQTLPLNFNPRSHERSDENFRAWENEHTDFNPRSHERSDGGLPPCPSESGISIHAPTRGATRAADRVIKREVFQSTLPREERLSPFFQSTNYKNFNPRSHERSDALCLSFGNPRYRISIHAPTRGATKAQMEIVQLRKISIHAPTRGATEKVSAKEVITKFQSTLPREERHDRRVFRPNLTQISIHAPTRGATEVDFCRRNLKIYFNPRSHERSDSNIAQKICLFLYNTDNKYIIR